MKIMGEMSERKYGRDSAILALGGGVVGDMAGFIAAIFNRGVPYIQIPSTILAQADSSIGGKTAVDTEYGKNLIGAFKQPQKVYIDISLLKTLSERDYRTGLAETIKHGIIQNADFFLYLQENTSLILERSPESSLHIARNNCHIKGRVVEIDPHEKGLRKILNYGHTIGHAIEKLSGFALSHGESISIGMMVAGRIACNLGYFSLENLSSQEKIILALGLSATIPINISNEAIIDITSIDKKASDGKATYVLPVSIGRMHEFNGTYATYVREDIILDALQRTR
jgi:3-dehydroquinate synthase